MTTPTLVSPRTGPCQPWITSDDIAGQPGCASLSVPVMATMATVASEVLYQLSRQQFTGACGPVTVRPVSRPVDVDTRSIMSQVGNGYLSSWGTCTASNMPPTGGVSHFGCSRPPDVDLGGYPITGIKLVKIDGIVIPPNEYYVQSFRKLVRRRPTSAATPTARWGWPTCQLEDLPDTEPGTFSVSYYYGVAPPATGILAAKTLGAQLTLNATGNPNRLPMRITSISREGISAMIVDVMDFLKDGMTGIYECDLFVKTFNPNGSKRKAAVFSPDLGRARRMPPGA